MTMIAAIIFIQTLIIMIRVIHIRMIDMMHMTPRFF